MCGYDEFMRDMYEGDEEEDEDEDEELEEKDEEINFFDDQAPQTY